MAVLVTVSDVGLGRRYSLGPECLIGRQPASDIQLTDSEVSKSHARIFQDEEGRFHIEDLKSRNGVYVSGRRIAGPTILAANDLIAIGSRALIFEPNFEILPEEDGKHAVILVDDLRTSEAHVARRSLSAPAVMDTELAALLALLATESPGPALVAKLMERVRRAIAYDHASVLAQTEGDLEPVFVASAGRTVSLPRGFLEMALKEPQGLVINDAIGDTMVSGGKTVINDDVRSLLVAPLLAGGNAVGLVFLVRTKPRTFDASELERLECLAPVLAVALSLGRRFTTLERRLKQASAVSASDILGKSAAVKRLKDLVRRAAATPTTVLILGETGSGKELVAASLHAQSQVARGPFVAINCAAIPGELLESELFGHERGAFSGATDMQVGKLELARGGTLFLDEIAELPLALQAKVLRALEEKSFYRVGGVKPVKVELRLIAATHRDLKQLVAAEKFREDLFFRLNVLSINSPPLRERRDDIPLLAEHFLGRFSRELGREVEKIDPDALARLCAYAWPGNVRELRNVIERAVVLCEGETIRATDLPTDLIDTAPPTLRASGRPLAEEVVALERARITEALRAARGKKVAAAQALGISRPTLDKKIHDYGIDLFEEQERP